MSIPRRGFLLGLGGAAVACRTPIQGVPKAVVDDWAAVRAQFALSPDWIHLSALLLASHPKVVRDAIERHRRGMDEQPVAWLHANEGTWRMHESAAAYLGVKREEIALTDSTTMGLGVVCSGLATELKAGDEIVTSTHDHYALYEATRLAAARTGAIVKRTPMYAAPSQANAQTMIDAVTKAITERTRWVAMTWVHSSSGVKIPLRGIADAIAAINASRTAATRILLLVDGVHGFGVESDDLPSLGCDVFVAGCHKWLFGPRGTGLIWARPEVFARMQPVIPHFGAESFEAWRKGVLPPPTNAFMMTPGGFHSFEHRWSLPEAFEFHLAIGKARVLERTRALNRRLKQGLASMKHVTLHTPLDDARSSGIVCFDVQGLSSEQVVERLKAKRIVANATPYAPSYARLTAAIYNTEAEIDRTLAVIAELA